MFKSSIVLIFLAIFCFKANAQNRQLAQKTIDTLASKSFYGRGYINGGDKKAALYIAQQFRNIGIKPLKKYEYFQPFSFWVNTFPGKCEVNAMNKILVPGKDYIVDPACPSINKWRLTLGGPNQTERDLNEKEEL